MRWSIVEIGKHKGLTLPQIALRNPGYILWALQEHAFRGRLEQEAELLAQRARSIRIPKRKPKRWRVEHRFVTAEHKYDGFRLVRAGEPEGGLGSIWLKRDKHINLFVVSEYEPFDKRGVKKLIQALKRDCFGSPKFRLTKQRCEEFFSNPENFDLPATSIANLPDQPAPRRGWRKEKLTPYFVSEIPKFPSGSKANQRKDGALTSPKEIWRVYKPTAKRGLHGS